MNTDLNNSRLTGMYRGKVLQHLPHGMLKVFVPGIHPSDYELNPDLIPPAEQLTPSFAGGCNGNGMFSYPNIGAIVICTFLNGDQNYPLVVGTTLGGQNAYGQYDVIYDSPLHFKQKMFKEISASGDQLKIAQMSSEMSALSIDNVSNHHLITSGSSHIGMFENGRIGMCVKVPNDNDVSVDFLSGIVAREKTRQLSTDEISNIVCQTVIDGTTQQGQISSSIHYNDVDNVLSTVYLSDENINITSGYTLNTKCDSSDIASNGFSHCNQQKKSYDYLSSYNETNLTTKYVYNHTFKENNTAESEFDQTLNGDTLILNANSTMSAVTDSAEQLMITDSCSDEHRFQLKKNDAILTRVSTNENCLTSSPQLNNIKSISTLAENEFGVGKDVTDIAYKSIKTNNGFTTMVDSKYTNEVILIDDIAYSVKLHGHVMSNGTSKLNSVFSQNVALKSGIADITLEDKLKGGICRLCFDNNGNIMLDSSRSITLRAPKIVVDGILEVTKPAICDNTLVVNGAISGKTVINASNDITCRGKSLPSHRHISANSGSMSSEPK